MFDHLIEIDIAGWVNKSRNDTVVYQQRQTIEIVFNTIATTVLLDTKMFLRGGILMGLAYSSQDIRQTLT